MTKEKITPSVEMTQDNSVSSLSGQTKDEKDSQVAVGIDSFHEPDIQENRVLAVVIIYNRQIHKINQLLLAIKSWRKFFDANIRIFVVGDSEDISGVTFISMEHDVNNRKDLLNVLKLAVMDERISEDFILAVSDTYLVSPITPDYIRIPKITDIVSVDEKTVNVLRGVGVMGAIYNFDTHTPMFINKANFIAINEAVQLEDTDVLTSLGMLSTKTLPVKLKWREDPWLLPVVTDLSNPKVFDDLVGSKCFIYNIPSAWSAALEHKLNAIIK